MLNVRKGYLATAHSKVGLSPAAAGFACARQQCDQKKVER